VVIVVAEQQARVRAEQPAGLLGDDLEDGLGALLAGDEGGHPPQRRLLGRQARELLDAVSQLCL
jgi:hypothetical protein